jgi:hypothetical protein
MRVRLLAERAREMSGWLRPDRSYLVLEVEPSPPGSTSYRLESENASSPALFPAEAFEVVSPRLPSSWIARYWPGSGLQLTPERWTVPGFWEAFFDGEEQAGRLYREERDRMSRELGE